MRNDNDKLMNRKDQKDNRNRLRRKATPAEKGLWKLLKDLRQDGIIFHRQHGIGKYIVDFYCPKIHLVIELDGQVHVGNEDYDAYREEYIKQIADVRFLRYENKIVFEHPERIIEDIKEIWNNSL